MAIIRPPSQAVKELSPKSRGKRPPLVELPDMCRRFHGYLRGCFARGSWYKIWDKNQFHRATLSERPRQVSYIEHAFRVFMQTSTVYHFEKIRIGRSQRIKVSIRGAPPIKLSKGEVSVRLSGYIKKAVLQRGVAHVDELFLRRFVDTSGLPRELVFIAWRRIKKIPGLRIRWRGTGAGKKFVASLPHFPTRHSSPTERRDRKSAGGDRRDDSNRSSASLRSAVEAPAAGEQRPRPSLGSTIHCVDPPFQIAGRWISSKRLLALACWLAAVAMRAAHVASWRVSWRFPHSRNFAYRALRDGHSAEAIVAAWGRGVARSHEEAAWMGAERRTREDDPEPETREPSAAVAYARGELARDKRPRERRWRELLEAERRPRELLAVKLPRVPAAAPAAVRRQSAEVLEELRAKLAAAQEPKPERVSTMDLIAFIEKKGFRTLANFNQLPWSMRQEYLAQCRADIEKTRQKG